MRQAAGSLVNRGVLPAAVALARRGDQVRAAVVQEADRLATRVLNETVSYVVARVDLTELVQNIDLVAVAQQMIDGVDLPAIIRQSSASVTSEAVRGVRVQGIEADQAVTRAIDHVFHRRRQQAPALPAVPAQAERGPDG